MKPICILFFSLSCLLPCAAAPVPTPTAALDTVELKTGEIIKGKVVQQADDFLIIEFQAGKGITDKRTLEMTEVKKVEKVAPDALAFHEISKLLPTTDLLTVARYDAMLSGQVEPFLEKFADSKYAKDAKKIAAALTEERDRVSTGDIKLNNKWIEAEDYKREKYWIDGEIATSQIQQATKNGKYAEALRRFDALKNTYPSTTILSKASVHAKAALRAYRSELSEALRTLPVLEKEREKRMGRLPPSDRAAAESMWEKERERFQKRMEESKKTGSRWVTLDPYNQQALENALSLAADESAEIARFTSADYSTQEALLRKIDAAVHDGLLESAAKAIETAPSDVTNIPYFQSLSTRVQAETARQREEAIEAERKRRDEEALARERAREEAEAERNRQEEERMAQEADGSYEGTSQGADGENYSGESPREKARKKADEEDAKEGGAISPVLIAGVGILVLVLIVALVLPGMRKKSTEEE